MTAAVRATARRWIALAAAAAIVAHAFGMGLLGPRMAESAAARLVAQAVSPPAAEDFAHHARAAADLADAGHHRPAGTDHEHSPEKHPPSCEGCPLGQSGMALAPPPVVPIAATFASIDSAAAPVRLLLVEAWPYRSPPARAPPTGIAV